MPSEQLDCPCVGMFRTSRVHYEQFKPSSLNSKSKMIEFLAEWMMVTLLMPASHVLEVRAPHLSFMMLKEYWFRELYLGLKVTASFDRSESHTRVINGQVRCITPEVKPQN